MGTDEGFVVSYTLGFEPDIVCTVSFMCVAPCLQISCTMHKLFDLDATAERAGLVNNNSYSSCLILTRTQPRPSGYYAHTYLSKISKAQKYAQVTETNQW
jgi:hypothetical protein